MKIAVVYKSKYGTTKQYALWISEALNADLMERSSINYKTLSGFDIVIYGGALYAGGVIGADFLEKVQCKNLIVFTVGLADPLTTDYSKILNKNLSEETRSRAKIFHLRGSMDYKKLGMVHRSMMAMMKKITFAGKSRDELSEEERLFLDSYGKKVNFVDRKSIKPVIDYVNNLIESLG